MLVEDTRSSGNIFCRLIRGRDNDSVPFLVERELDELWDLAKIVDINNQKQRGRLYCFIIEGLKRGYTVAELTAYRNIDVYEGWDKDE